MLSEMEESGAENASLVNRTLRDWQGRISFVKTLGTSAVSQWYQLSLPSTLWRQHGDKIGKCVILQSVADRKQMWTVGVSIYFKNKYPQVLLQNRWKAFVVGNGLVKGDQLKFTLTAISKFEVVILRSVGEQKVPSLQSPKLRSKDSAFSHRKPKKSLGRQCLNSLGKCYLKSERELNVKKEVAEDNVAHSASNVTDSSGSLSDMDSHFYEPMMEQEECQEALRKSFNDSSCHSQCQNALPRFCKRISGRNAPEIPYRFLKSHWTEIGSTYVKLQGIHEGSPVHNVTCTSVIDGGRPRLFFKSCCWNDFVKDNCLQIGQRLSFTLTAHSFFVVRNSE